MAAQGCASRATLKDGLPTEGQWFDEPQLVMVKRRHERLRETGGPCRFYLRPRIRTADWQERNTIRNDEPEHLTVGGLERAAPGTSAPARAPVNA
jgi:hypothetical protein